MTLTAVDLREQIEAEIPLVAARELFTSAAYQRFINDLVNSICERYDRPVKVIIDWDERPEAEHAWTDNDVIYINAGNPLIQSLPTLALKHAAIIGYAGHEAGHILFTDFQLREIYGETLMQGRMYPKPPQELEQPDARVLVDVLSCLGRRDKIEVDTVVECALTLQNILEDYVIEDAMCETFSGSIKRGITLKNARHYQLIPSISKQIEDGYHPYAIMVNCIIHYCKFGEVNNLQGYEGEYLEKLDECMPLIDAAIINPDGKERLDVCNCLVVKIWPYVLKMIEHAKTHGSTSRQKVKKQIVTTPRATGNSQPVTQSGEPEPKPGAQSTSGGNHSGGGRSGLSEAVAEIERAIQITQSIEDGADGGLFDLGDYEADPMETAGAGILEILAGLAKEKVLVKAERKMTVELARELKRMEFGNNHRGIAIHLHRMVSVPQCLADQYKLVAKPIESLCEIIKQAVLPLLTAKQHGMTLRHQITGLRIDSKHIADPRSRLFVKKRNPMQALDAAASIVDDESASMSSCGRIEAVRAASLVLLLFCRDLGIPISVVGHTASSSQHTMELYCYADFEAIDDNDKYRLMDIQPRDCNRDGAAIRYAAERLLKRPERLKLLFVNSDGAPVACGYRDWAAKQETAYIERMCFREEGTDAYRDL